MSPDDDAAPRTPRSQTDVVIEGIKAMITSGRLGAGDRLPIEKDLATELGVSRGSLREAIRALALLGVVETRQGDGTYVTSLDPISLLGPLGFLADLQLPANAAHLLGVRRILESETASLAAVRMTESQLAEAEAILAGVDENLLDESSMDLEAFIEADARFHATIAAASGNPALAALVDTLVGRTFRARLWRAITERGSVRETQAEHRAILAALVRRDSERARARMVTHLLGVEDFADEHPTADDISPLSGPEQPAR